MLLSSPSFILFFLITALMYYLLPAKDQKWTLLVFSLAFYCFNTPQYLPLIVAEALWTFLFGKKVDSANTEKQKKVSAAVGVSGVLTLFIFIRFFSKAAGNLVSGTFLSQWFVNTDGLSVSSLILPVGISFYSLSLAGYLIDVCDGKILCERNFLTFLNYVIFFPTILSGPINRAEKLLPQFREIHKWNYGRTVTGLRRFLIGAVKKVVLADGLSLLVNGVWDNLHEYTGLSLIAVMFLYSLQLYGDFSGYSDMALGTAYIFGFEIDENFTAPFMAQRFSDLWARWHNSLSGWLKTYIYIPLGGGRKGFARKILNIFIVFIISGMWHGVNGTFILWGLLTAVFRTADELLYRNNKNSLSDTGIIPWIRRTGVFVLFSVVFVFFRAGIFPDAVYFFENLLRGISVSTFVQQFKWLPTADIADGAFYSVLYWGGLLYGLIITVWSDLFVYRNPGCTDGVLSRVNRSSARMIIYWISGILVMLFYFIQYTKNSGSVSFIYAGF